MHLSAVLLVVSAFFAPAAQADTWTLASSTGMGSAFNTELNRGATFYDGTDTYLYFGSSNAVTGAQVWRSSDGLSWNQVNTSGFDDFGSSNTSAGLIAVFNNRVYASADVMPSPQAGGARLYRSDSTGTSPWTLVFSSVTTGNNNTSSISSFEIFSSSFYITTKNLISGAEIWSSTSADHEGAWVQVSTGGFGGNQSNATIDSLRTFNGYLYAAAGAADSASAAAGQLWRTTNGTTWTQVLVASKTFSANTRAVSSLESFNGYLYAGTLNSQGAQLWRTADPDPVFGSWTQVFSPDGNTAFLDERFSVSSSSQVHTLSALNGFLYAGTWDPSAASGTRLYRSLDGETWTLSNLAGFDATSTQWIGGLISTGTFVYAGTRNDVQGGAVWRAFGYYPGQPTIAGTALGVSSITWSWSSVTRASGFRIVSSTGGNLSGDLSADTSSWTETELSTNTSYVRSAAAFNEMMISTSTALTRYTLTDLVSGSAFQSVFGSSVALTWNANTNPAGTLYHIRVWRTGTSTTTTTSTAANAAITGLFGASTYYFSVLAVNGDGIPGSPDVTVSSVTFPVYVADATITASSGTVLMAINTPAGIMTMSIPGHSFTSDVTITIQEPPSFPATTASAAARLQATGVGLQVDIAPLLQPSNPVTFSLPYLNAAVLGLEKNKLILARFDTPRNIWVPLVSQSDPESNTVTARTNHLSTFQLMGVLTPNDLSSAKAFPNPLRPAQGQTTMTFSGLPESARIRIYTLAGELVKDMTASAAGIAGWDGTNQTGATAGSGVYFVFAQGAGEKKTFKVAIQR